MLQAYQEHFQGPFYNPNFNDYLKLIVAREADSNNEICLHWISNRIKREFAPSQETDPYVPIYNLRKISIIFDEVLTSHVFVRIECLSCKKNHLHQAERFKLTTLALIKKINQYESDNNLIDMLL